MNIRIILLGTVRFSIKKTRINGEREAIYKNILWGENKRECKNMGMDGDYWLIFITGNNFPLK